MSTARRTSNPPQTLGVLPRKSSTSLGNLLSGSPSDHRPGGGVVGSGAVSFGRTGSFGRVGANVEPAVPIGRGMPLGGAGGGKAAMPGSRRLGSFNSLNSPAKVEEKPTEREKEESKEEYPLEGEWTFWFMHRNPAKKMSEDEFSRAMKRLGSCATVHSFFSLYLHLRRPSSLPAISDLHLFASPIQPVWEDPSNARGGKWTIRLRKGLADRLWEGVVLGLVGGGFERGAKGEEGEAGEGEEAGEKEVCGAVLSVRRDEDILAVWHRTGDHDLGGDGEAAKRVKSTLQSLLSLPPSCQLAYKLNAESLDKTAHHGGHAHKRKDNLHSSVPASATAVEA